MTYWYQKISKARVDQWFYALCVLHLVGWTLGPTLFRASVTHDTLEAIAWGMQWQWGYDKHPPLNAWLAALATQLGGTVGWPVYLLAQIAVVTTFVAVYKLAQQVMVPIGALMSVLLLEGIIYHTINSVNLTPDTMQTPFWALLTLAFYFALQTQKLKCWIAVGCLTGLATLTKYAIGFLLVAMAIVAFSTQFGRNSFKHLGLYVSVAIFLVIISPHLVWAYQQGFTGLLYIQESVSDAGDVVAWYNHIKYPFKYLVSQLGVILVPALMLWPFYVKNKEVLSDQSAFYSIEPFDVLFFTVMGMTPIVLTTLFGVFSGTHMIGRWSTPYFYLFGILFFIWFRPALLKKRFKQFIVTAIIVASLICVSRNTYYIWSPMLTGNTRSDAFLPNKEIAETMHNIWHKKFDTPFQYIAAPHYLAAYISAYAPSAPKPYMDWSLQQSPWVDLQDLKSKGGIFAWEVKDRGETIPEVFLKMYPTLLSDGVHVFDKKVPVKAEPIYILVGILPPSH